MTTFDEQQLAAAFAAWSGLVPVRAEELEALPAIGLAHRHWRVRGQGFVLRVPVQPIDLAREASAFMRAGPSGHVPRLHGVIPASPALPYGALVVEEIVGHAPKPADMNLIAMALAALHRLEVPRTAEPLPAPAEPFAATLAEIERVLAEPGGVILHAETQRQIDDERAWLAAFARNEARHLAPVCALIGTDTHPGNFLIAPDGRAVFVDLEKAQYANPAMDAAHASLGTSTRWDRHGFTLAAEQVADFYRAWLIALDAALADRLRPWLAPFRRLVWLRTTAMYARRIGRDEALSFLEPAMQAHARRVIAECLEPRTVVALRKEWLQPAPAGIGLFL
jgi:hypothetical protein